MEILVVDDEVALRTAVRRALVIEGYEVSEAADGEQALDALAVGGRDVVILDVLMPGLGGLEVCRHLRRVGDRTPILMLTARETVSDRVAGLEAGADDYLVKPFALEELLARAKALLRRASPQEGEAERVSYGPVVLEAEAREAAWTARC
jgi:two-component system response regulator MprA